MNPRAVAGDATRELAGRLGDRLRSVVLYGSAARGEFSDGASDINLLVLLDRIDAPLLRRLAPVAPAWTDQRINAMLLEDREWSRAADAFAIELLDMHDAAELLHGEDPVRPLSIEPAHARLQAERELRSRIIALHNGMVRTADAPAQLGALLVAALPAFATYLRTTLRLTARPVPGVMRDVIEQATRLAGAPPDGLLAALDARRRGGEWSVDLDGDVVESYNAAVERTAWYIDSLGGRTA